MGIIGTSLSGGNLNITVLFVVYQFLSFYQSFIYQRLNNYML